MRLEVIRREIEALEREMLDGEVDEVRKIGIRNDLMRLREKLKDAEREALSKGW